MHLLAAAGKVVLTPGVALSLKHPSIAKIIFSVTAPNYLEPSKKNPTTYYVIICTKFYLRFKETGKTERLIRSRSVKIDFFFIS
jgi:hypothetical protein